MSDPTDTPPPAAVSDCVGNAGTPYALRWRDREYPLALPCPAVIARLEKYVLRAALDALAEHREVYTPAEFAAFSGSLQAKIGAKEYRPGGKLWNAEMSADGGVRGMLLMIWGCLAEAHAGKEPAPTYADVVGMYHEAEEEVVTAAAFALPDFTKAAAERRMLPPAAVAKEVRQAAERAAKSRAKAAD